jgi:hypothetical protein
MGRANYEKIDGAFANSADDKRWPRPYEEILVSVWRQALVEGARTVTVGDKSFPVRRILASIRPEHSSPETVADLRPLGTTVRIHAVVVWGSGHMEIASQEIEPWPF